MATLFDYYKSKGQRLPSVGDRAAVYEKQGLGPASSYRGTAQQNTGLLARLTASDAAGGAGPAPGTAGGPDPAAAGIGNQDPNRQGAAAIPTAEETLINRRNAVISKSVDPQRSLVDRILEAYKSQPSKADLLRQERDAAGVGKFDAEIAKTQDVLDSITSRLSSTLRFEENRAIPLGLLRGRQREAELQAAEEMQPMETRLSRLTARRGQAAGYASDIAEARSEDAARDVTAAEKALALDRALMQPGREMERDYALKQLEPKEEEKPEFKVINRSLVKINPDGTVESVFTAPTAASGKGGASDEDKQVQNFLDDASDMINKLDRAEISWGAAWDYLRTRYPQASPETIDSVLGGSVDFNPETGEFGEARGRAKTSTKQPGVRPPSTSGGNQRTMQLPDGTVITL